MAIPPKTHSQQTWTAKLPAAGILILILLGAWWFGQRGDQPQSNEPAAPGPQLRPVDASDHIRGRVDAPYTLIEYGDIACSFCQAFHPRVTELLAEHPDDIRWVWRWFPHDVNVDAYTKAEAGECAAEQGLFWEYIDGVFVAGVGLTVTELNLVADVVGLDVAAYEECIASGRHKARVLADVDEVSRLGGEATPFTLIMTPDNQVFPLAGAASYEQLNGLLNDLLQGKSPSFQY